MRTLPRRKRLMVRAPRTGAAFDRHGQGRRQGHSGAQRQADWNGLPRSGTERVRRRPDLPSREGGEQKV